MNFLGSTTAQYAVARVVTGVQDTGENIWPLLVFAGIFLAFVIGALLVDFIRESALMRRSKAARDEFDRL